MPNLGELFGDSKLELAVLVNANRHNSHIKKVLDGLGIHFKIIQVRGLEYFLRNEVSTRHIDKLYQQKNKYLSTLIEASGYKNINDMELQKYVLLVATSKRIQGAEANSLTGLGVINLPLNLSDRLRNIHPRRNYTLRKALFKHEFGHTFGGIFDNYSKGLPMCEHKSQECIMSQPLPRRTIRPEELISYYIKFSKKEYCPDCMKLIKDKLVNGGLSNYELEEY